MKRLLLALALCGLVAAQPPALSQLPGLLLQAQQEAQAWKGPEHDPVLAGRLQILTHQAEQLALNRGDLDVFLSYYTSTQQVVANLRLPPRLQATWLRIQEQMVQLAQQTGRKVNPPVLSVLAEGWTGPAPEVLQEALDAATQLETTLPARPGGTGGKRYDQARQVLASLRTHLQRALQEVRAGQSEPPSYGQLLQDRRRWYVWHSALQLPASQLWRLQASLERLPVR